MLTVSPPFDLCTPYIPLPSVISVLFLPDEQYQRNIAIKDSEQFWSSACPNIELVHHNHCYYDPQVVHKYQTWLQPNQYGVHVLLTDGNVLLLE